MENLKLFTINFGPQHPAAHGVLRLILNLNGEVVERADPHIGLLHRGTEKLLEIKTYIQGLPYFDRLDYVSMMSQEHTFVLAIEKIANISIHKRKSYIRILFCEITRILNHLLAIGCHALDVGAMTPMFWTFEERERLLEFYERASGARMHANFIRPGGISYELPLNFLDDVYLFIKLFVKRLDEIDEFLLNNRIWKQRLVDVGTITVNEAKKFGFSGVLLRSTGVCWDIRKNEPYELYDTIDFNIPIGKNGDCFDRYNLRMLEMRESCSIIIQSLNYLIENKSDVISKYHDRFDSKYSMEDVIKHFKYFVDGLVLDKDCETYVSTESPKGEFGVFLKSDGFNKPYRCKVKAPGFSHLQSLEFLTKKNLIADVVTIIGTLDIVFGEIDR